MTQEKAKILIKIGKWFAICLLAMFFVIIIIQSVKINNLSSQKQKLQNEFQIKSVENSLYQSEIDYIENNKDAYSENELRKENFKKPNETMVEAK